jgi:peptide/nickel transport system substrate-binding protein
MAFEMSRPSRLSRRAFLATHAVALTSGALGRTPYGGRLRLTVPWPIAGIDPASLGDGFSALFAGALFEPLYAVDAAGAPYPTLAEALPAKQSSGCRVKLRPGLKTAAGRALGGADIVATLARARARGAVGLLGEIDAPTVDPQDSLSVVFAQAGPELVARALASPLLALVPRSFSPLSPDGCGAFKIELAPGRAVLTRNPNAARGPAFLDAIEVSSAADLAELLRGFEVGQTDVGWFGSGLYRAVKDATPFEAPRYGLAVLVPGRGAGAWGAPGTLQGLLDAIPAPQLSHLGLRGLPTQALGSPAWGGPATSIAVLAGAPQLVAVARAVAASLSTPGHELTVLEKSSEELASLQSSRQFGLLVDCVRAPSAAPRELELALRSAASPETAKRAPKTAPVAPRELGRQLALGVIGDLTMWGARRASFVGIETWQLGSVYVRPTS